MTSPVATVALTYDAVDIQDLDGIHLQITKGLFEVANVRGTDVVVPGADGRTIRPRRFDRRQILLAGEVRAAGDVPDQDDRRSDYRDNLNTLRTLFDETGTAKDLVATLENGEVWTCPARCVDRIVNEAILSEEAKVSIELEALSDWVVT